jgi:hypothetical protein
MESLATILHHFGAVWERRHLPNVAVFHYADYQVDLVGELIRLGQVLGVGLDRDRAKELTPRLRSRSQHHRRDRRSDEGFFRAGGRGEWMRFFSPRPSTARAARLGSRRAPRARPRTAGTVGGGNPVSHR